MFQNLNSLNYLQEINCDYCIVGSGPAGITLANSLDKKYKIVLCEAGDFLQTDSSTDCYKGEVIGDPYFELDVCRLRQFGGTSGHWGGWSRTLDDVDFVKKNLNKLAYWPIEKKDLDIYLD